MRKAIAMKCSKEQFDAVKGKLNIEVNDGTFDLEKYPYLVNNYDNGKCKGIGTNDASMAKYHNREIHETWNEKIFLEACGIETDYKITKKQILQAHNAGFIRIKEWFPEAFKKELEVGKWYKCFGNLCVYNGGKDTYGWWLREWSDRISFFKFETTDDDIKEATDQEVESALIAEAKKRGFKAGSKYLSAWNNEMTCDYPEKLFYDPSKNCLSTHGGNECIFQNGTWATIVPTITKAEAEKRLGVKIE